MGGVMYWCCSPRCQGDYGEEYEAKLGLLPMHRDEPHERGGNSTAVGYQSVVSDDEDDNLFTKADISAI